MLLALALPASSFGRGGFPRRGTVRRADVAAHAVAGSSSKPPSWEALEAQAATPANAEPAQLTLYRDNNGWCPFCERVWLALELKGLQYDEKLINLRNKPRWYLDIVPTTLVPAVEMHDASFDPATPGSGELVWESMDVLRALDAKFPEPKLFTDSPLEQEVIAEVEALLASSFKFTYGTRNASLSAEDKAQRRADFERDLAAFDARVTSHGGPFACGDSLSAPDLMLVPMMERYRFQLALMAGPTTPAIYGNPKLPGVTRWFDALDEVPAYRRRVAGDAYSWTAVTSTFLRLFAANSTSPEDLARADAAADGLLTSGVDQAWGAASTDWDAGAALQAARKLIANNAAIVADATNADPKSQQDVPRVLADGGVAEVDEMLRATTHALLTGEAPAAANSPVQAAAARVVATRLCAPRDMGAPAARLLRSALMITATTEGAAL